MRHKDPELKKEICVYINHFYSENFYTPSQRKIAEALGVSHTSVYRYLAEMEKDGMITSNEGKITGTDFIDHFRSDYVAGPVIDLGACADSNTKEEQVEEYVLLPTAIFGKRDLFILRITGESMIDTGIRPGVLVVVHKQQTAEIGDVIVALDDENRYTLKRYGGTDPETGKEILLYQNKEKYPGRKILVDKLVMRGVASKVISDLCLEAL